MTEPRSGSIARIACGCTFTAIEPRPAVGHPEEDEAGNGPPWIEREIVEACVMHEDWRARLSATSPASDATHDGELDVAWRAAQEACFARGVFLEELTAFNRNGWWQAAAWEDKGDTPHTTATGQGPVAALLALAARLATPEVPDAG